MAHRIAGIVAGSLIAALGPCAASAAPYVMADPRVDPAWGGQPGMPTAPSAVQFADIALPATLAGTARTAEYVRRLLASAVTLDEAVGFHLYSPVSGIHPVMNLPNLGPATIAQAEAVAARERSAEPRLLAELDARFGALAAAVRRADSIVPPPPSIGAMPPEPVFYCRFIYNSAELPRPGLGDRLWKRCIENRDAFLETLVVRMADIAVIPGLPAANGPMPPTMVQRDPPADLVLSPQVLPGEVRAPLPAARLAAPFEERLRGRFEAERPRLRAELDAALDRRAETDVILPPTDDCRGMLGPYAAGGPLARLPAAATVAGELGEACTTAVVRWLPTALERLSHGVASELDAEASKVRDGALDSARIAATPEAICAGILAPHFPAGSVAYGTNAFPEAPRFLRLRQSCVSQAMRVRDATIERHLAAALAGSRPSEDPPAAWAAHGWFAGPPGGTSWIDGRADPGGVARFDGAYEAAMAPRRKEAATRFAAAIERAFAVDTGIEPTAATTACGGPARPRASGLDAAFGFKVDPVDERHSREALWAKPGLTAGEASALVGGACRALRDATMEARVRLAIAASAVDRVFGTGVMLAVPRHADGGRDETDALALVRAAAVDGIQVAFEPGGPLSDPVISIVPIGAKAPRLDGTMRAATAEDGTKALEIRALAPLPGLRTPEETLACLTTPADEAAGAARLNTFSAIAGLAASYVPEIHGPDVRDAIHRQVAVAGCAAAKKEFVGGAVVQ